MASPTHLNELLGFELFELLPDALIVVDRQGVIRYANRQAGRLFRQEVQALVSCPVETLLPEHLRERHIAYRAEYNCDPHMRPMGTGLDLVARRSDGTTCRIILRGPDLTITAKAAQAIGMAIHELATNAGKYGALSNEIGHVDIAWCLEPDEHRFRMEWSESGGPIVVPPTRRAFGWSVLCELTKMSLGADVTLEHAPTGVVWRLGCPADRVCET